MENKSAFHIDIWIPSYPFIRESMLYCYSCIPWYSHSHIPKHYIPRNPWKSPSTPPFFGCQRTAPDSRPARWAVASAREGTTLWPGPCRRSRHSHRSGWGSWLLVAADGGKAGESPAKISGDLRNYHGEIREPMRIKNWFPGVVNMGIWWDLPWNCVGNGYGDKTRSNTTGTRLGLDGNSRIAGWFIIIFAFTKS